MTKIELLNEIKTRNLQIAEIMDMVATEKREMLQVEKINADSLKREMAEFEKQIVELDKQAVSATKVGEDRSVKGFNLVTAIRDQVESRSANESTLSMNEIGRKSFVEAGLEHRGQIVLPAEYRNEYRADIIAGTDANGKYAVPVDKFDLIAGLRAQSVLFKAGATLMSGLKGNVSIPVYGNSTVSWATETAAATDGASTFSELTMSPKRITGYLDISKLFLAQTSPSAEALLQNDIIAAVIGLLESTAFGVLSGSTSRPAGMLYGASYGYNTGTTSYATVVRMESNVNTANALAGTLAYVTTPALKGTMKTTPRTPTYGNSFIMEGGEANGYPVYTTSLMNSGKVIFGNWQDYIVGQWGGLDLLVDPYSVAIYGKVRLVINAYFDMIKRRTASFNYANIS